MKSYEGNALFTDLFVVSITINKNYKIINKKKDREEQSKRRKGRKEGNKERKGNWRTNPEDFICTKGAVRRKKVEEGN